MEVTSSSINDDKRGVNAVWEDTEENDDSISIILSSRSSYDFRNREEVKRRWHDASVFGSRADFLPGRRPAMLTLRDLRPTDQSLYKCRVDFQHSRTRNALVNLTVISKWRSSN